MHNTAVAVWSFNHQRFVYFIPCPGEKRVRIDVHDGVHNYAVYPAIYHDNGTKLLRIGRNCVLYTHGTKQTARQSRRRLGL